MVNKSLSLLAPSQVPEFIAADAPKFVEFLQAYYQFVDQYRFNIERLRDVDAASTELLTFLKSEFAARYPQAAVNDRKLIKIIRDMYRSKGTLSGVEMLFRIFFNEAITIQQPGQNILRASDGRWQQEHSITLTRQFGSIDYNQPIVFRIENDRGIFFLEVDRYEILTGTDTRFFYKSYRQVSVDENQYVDIVTPTGEITYRGLLIKSPSSISIVDPGESWKLGQVVLIDSVEEQIDVNGNIVTTQPTIARVTQIGPNGEMLAIEIIQYGTLHTEGQSAIVSPYPNKPSGADWDLTATVIGVDVVDGEQVPRYGYTLTLNSFTVGVRESILGLSNAKGGDSYFLEDYTLDFYNARIVLQQVNEGASRSLGVIVTDPELTTAEWLASRATLIYNFDYIVKYKGSFTDDRGQLSNTNIRLQDNYFYQLFSYVIQTTQQVSDYRNVLNLIHPAGLKYFGELTKTAEIDVSQLELSQLLSRSRIYLQDELTPADLVALNVVKPLFDSASVIEDITSFNITKAVTDIAVTAETHKFSVTKSLSDTFASAETTTFIATKSLSDETLLLDQPQFQTTKPVVDTTTADEVVSKAVARAPVIETATVDDGSSSINSTSVVYNAENYFSESYAAIGFDLTIG